MGREAGNTALGNSSQLQREDPGIGIFTCRCCVYLRVFQCPQIEVLLAHSDTVVYVLSVVASES